MVRLSETRSKAILADAGVQVPTGDVATSPAEARTAASGIDPPYVVKAQVGVTKRADRGLVQFAETPDEVAATASKMIGREVAGSLVKEVRVERRHDVEAEWYAGVVIDSTNRTPRVLFSTAGGTGVETTTEERPEAVLSEPVPIERDLRTYEAYDLVRRLDVHGGRLQSAGSLVATLTSVFRSTDARSVEVNPIGVTPEDELIALDARISIDDAAVERHPEIEVEVAREFGRDPTELEKIAYQVERGDYRGTFYFVQTETDVEVVARGDDYVGFHGAGGGGSMMSLDAVTRAGLREPNYTDTSGNPPASKIYKAARIILSQPGIVGYLYSGSGAASQEMYTTARGLMKAFVEEGVTIPIVLRLGGNAEDRAIEIVDAYADQVPGPIEAYGGEKSAQYCVDRLAELIEVNRTDPDRAAEMATNAAVDPGDLAIDLEIDEDLSIPGLTEYRARIGGHDAVQELKEVAHKWVF